MTAAGFLGSINRFDTTTSRFRTFDELDVSGILRFLRGGKPASSNELLGVEGKRSCVDMESSSLVWVSVLAGLAKT
jgi:hypothetical protein